MQARAPESVINRVAKLLNGDQPQPVQHPVATPRRTCQQPAPPEASELPELSPLDPSLERLFGEARVADEEARIWEVRLDQLEAGAAVIALDGAAQVELLIHCLEQLTPFAASYHEKGWRSRRRDNELAVIRLVLDDLLGRSLRLTETQMLRITTVLGHFGLRGWMANPPEMVNLFESYAREHALSGPARRGLERARKIVYWGTANAERRRLMERFDGILDGSSERS